jgi:DNA-binding response OmpR family regulator
MTRILVIDDDETLLRFLRLLLLSSNYLVDTAAGANLGLQAMTQQSPDLIILDLSMPLMDGREFYREARLRGYDGPVLLCSAGNVDQARRELGAEASIAKPFDPETLLAMVERLVSVSGSRADGV